MDLQRWTLHPGDKPGQTLQMDIAAALSTLVDYRQTALRIERAQEVRIEESRVVYLLNPICYVHGQPVASSTLRTALLPASTDPTEKPPAPLAEDHPVLDCMAGILNARAILQWWRTGQRYRLEHYAAGQRTRYVPGVPSAILADVETISTPHVAKAAALGMLGMPLYNVTGTATAPLFIVQRFSQGMQDAQGDAIRYDAKEFILGEDQDLLPLDHPYMLAYRARKNYEKLNREVTQLTELLLLTPDAFGKTKKGIYDPTGKHAYIDPNAPDKVWAKVEDSFFG